MKRITIYVLSLNYGGAEKAITDIANILAINNEVTIKSIYNINEKSFFSLNKKIKVIYLTNLKPNKEEFNNALASLNFIKAFQEGVKSLKILYQKKTSIIKSLKMENSDIIITTRKDHNYYSCKYASKNIIKIGQEHNDFYDKKSIRKVLKGAKKLDYFMPSSKYLTNKYQVLLSKYPVKVKYIPLCIDEYDSHPKFKENQIIAVGRLEKIKGFNDLIEVFKIVHQRCPKTKLIIVGSGSEYSKLISLVKAYNLEKNVIFKGVMEKDKLQKEYAKSMLLICTSFSESFGLVALESANSKTGTIAFDSANGLKEILDKSGILIPNRDKKLMANTIIELLNKPEKCFKLGVESKKTISKYYTKNVTKDWYEFLKKIAK